MYKQKEMILNPQINELIAKIGHFQQIVICDAGLPIPDDNYPTIIDLSLIDGFPSFEQVFAVFEKYMAIEKMYLAKEIKTKNKKLSKLLNDSLIKTEYVTHEDFKDRTSDAIAFVRTGEQSPYANVILVAGVNF